MNKLFVKAALVKKIFEKVALVNKVLEKVALVEKLSETGESCFLFKSLLKSPTIKVIDFISNFWAYFEPMSGK